METGFVKTMKADIMLCFAGEVYPKMLGGILNFAIKPIA